MRRPHVYERTAPRAKSDHKYALPDHGSLPTYVEINAGGRRWLSKPEGWADIGEAVPGLPNYDDRANSHIWPRAKPDLAAPAARSAETARSVSRALPALIDVARAEGLDRLADALEVARAEAEQVASGRAVGVIR